MKAANVLQEFKILYVDTSVVIYYVEDFPMFADRAEFVFRKMDVGQLQGVTSTITRTEMLTKPIEKGEYKIEAAYRRLFDRSRFLQIVEVTNSIADQAAELRAHYNLKTPDALHVATAIQTGCDAFLTNDR